MYYPKSQILENIEKAEEQRQESEDKIKEFGELLKKDLSIKNPFIKDS